MDPLAVTALYDPAWALGLAETRAHTRLLLGNFAGTRALHANLVVADHFYHFSTRHPSAEGRGR